MILSREDMETRMKRLVRQYAMMDRVLEFDESVAELEKVSAGQVEALARELLQPESFNLLAFGSGGLRGPAQLPLLVREGVRWRPIIRCAGQR